MNRTQLVNDELLTHAACTAQPDLLGHWIVYFSWQTPQAAADRSATEVLFSRADAEARMGVFIAHKKKAGYRVLQ